MLAWRIAGDSAPRHRHRHEGRDSLGAQGERVLDASPTRLRQECETSLRRLRRESVDLLYLHAPDGRTPMEESAAALARLQQEGKARFVGASNVSLAQLKTMHSVCQITAVQPAYNMLLRRIERDLIPWCLAQQIAVVPYWPLMKGLLAGKLARDHQFRRGDGRPKYAAFQGEEWRKNQDLLDQLRDIATECGRSVAELVVNWTIHQPGITSALCGAKRAQQIRESAAAMRWQLSDAQRQRINQALMQRGTPVEDKAV